jgi:chromosome transmission fidelity protein 1
VIPPEQLLALSIGKGPLGKVLDCRHEARGRDEVMDELGQLLFNLAGVVPEGLVVFVASFQYLEQLMARWEVTGMKARMESRKKLLR